MPPRLWPAGDRLLDSMLYTTTNVLIAVAIGGAVGTVFGLITAHFELARAILDPATMTAGTVPILEDRLACHRSASLPVPLGEEHPPTEYGARHPARLVDRPMPVEQTSPVPTIRVRARRPTSREASPAGAAHP